MSREVLVSRAIGLDVHRDFCEVAIREGGRTRSAGRVASSPERLELFAASLAPSDRVVLEATGNAWAIAQVLQRHVAEVVLAHPKNLRAIAESKVKTDKVDARVLAELLAADYIPRVWIGDEQTRMLRRLVSRRRGLVKRRTQIKNEIQSVLHRNIKARPPARICSAPAGGRGWPSKRCRWMSA
jgi:transposase